jgi:Tfp pilus assembly protein PilO
MKRRGPLIAALVGAAVVILMVVALIVPRGAAVRARQKDVEAARLEQRSLTTQLEVLRDDQKMARKNRKKLNALQAKVPPTADLPGLIRLLNTAADQSAVDFMSLSPATPAAAGLVSAITAEITVSGGYFAVDQFLYRLETLPRTARVVGLTLNQGASGEDELQAVVSAVFFTTDISSGPGSQPGPNEGTPATVPTPTPGG